MTTEGRRIGVDPVVKRETQDRKTEKEQIRRAALEQLFRTHQFPLEHFFGRIDTAEILDEYVPSFPEDRMASAQTADPKQERIRNEYTQLATSAFHHGTYRLRTQFKDTRNAVITKQFSDAGIDNITDVNTILSFVAAADTTELAATFLTEEDNEPAVDPSDFDDTRETGIQPVLTSTTSDFPIVVSDTADTAEMESALLQYRADIRRLLKRGDREAILEALFGIAEYEQTRLEEFKQYLQSQSEQLLHIAQTHISLEGATYHDGLLPSLYNKRGIEQEFERMRTEAVANNHVTVVVYFDVNNFRQLNNDYGHDAGDAALVEIGARLQRIIRSADAAARMGGDEFSALLNIPADMVPKIQERIDTAFANLPARGDVQIGISGGLVVMSADDQRSLGEVIEQAEIAGFFKKLSRDSGIAQFDEHSITQFRQQFDEDEDVRNEFIKQLARRELNRQINAAESQTQSTRNSKKTSGKAKLELYLKQLALQEKIAAIEVAEAQTGDSDKGILNKLFA